MDHRGTRPSLTDPGWRPPPWQPGRPPAEPPHAPVPDAPRRPPLDDWLQQRLFDQRVVLVRGHLDGETVARVAAQLVALDALGGHRITVHIDSPDGDLEAALLLMDTMDSLHVPVQAVATGSVGGAALGVLAAARQRIAFPHARFRLVEPRTGQDFAGTVDQLVTQSRLHEDMLAALVRRLAHVALKAPESVRRDLREGRYLTAPEAVEYGLVETVTRSADPRNRPGSGFTAGNDDAG